MTIRSFPAATALVVGLSLLLTACGDADVLDLEPAAATDPAVEEPATEAPAPEPAEPEAPTETEAAPEPEPAVAPDLDCSAQGAVLEVRPVEGMPAEVAAARDFLLDAALRCDEQLLFTAIEESEMFSFSFGDDTDAIGYWWDLEEAGEAPYLRLAQVLSTTPAPSAAGDMWVWPQVATDLPEHTTDAAWAELTWVDDPAATLAAPEGYIGWRTGITLDGQWRFFVAGD